MHSRFLFKFDYMSDFSIDFVDRSPDLLLVSFEMLNTNKPIPRELRQVKIYIDLQDDDQPWLITYERLIGGFHEKIRHYNFAVRNMLSHLRAINRVLDDYRRGYDLMTWTEGSACLTFRADIIHEDIGHLSDPKICA